MSFSERLNRLMQIMGTNNNRLAKAMNLDASLVSRWRTGKRTPKKLEGHALAIAAYYVRSAQALYQRAALLEVLGVNSEPIEDDELERLVASWLQEEDAGTQALTSVSSVEKRNKEEISFRCFTDSYEEVYSHFLRRILSADAGDVLCCLGTDIPWLMGEELYEQIHAAFRLVLLSGRSVSLILPQLSGEEWEHIFVLWYDLAKFGPFSLYLSQKELLTDCVCLCDKEICIAQPSEKGHTLYINGTDSHFIRVQKYRLGLVRDQSAVCLASTNEIPKGERGIAIRSRFEQLPSENENWKEYILVLPKLSSLYEQWETESSEELEVILESIDGWISYMQRHPETPVCIWQSESSLFGGEKGFDLYNIDDDVLIEECDARGQVIRVSDERWKNDLLSFRNSVGSREDTIGYLEDCRNHLLSLDDKTVDEMDNEIAHPVYGNCFCRKSGEAEFFYAVGNGLITVFRMKGGEESVSNFLQDLERMYPLQYNRYCYLAPLRQEDGTPAEQALRWGFRPSGILCTDNGKPWKEADGGEKIGEMRIEMIRR